MVEPDTVVLSRDLRYILRSPTEVGREVTALVVHFGFYFSQ